MSSTRLAAAGLQPCRAMGQMREAPPKPRSIVPSMLSHRSQIRRPSAGTTVVGAVGRGSARCSSWSRPKAACRMPEGVAARAPVAAPPTCSGEEPAAVNS